LELFNESHVSLVFEKHNETHIPLFSVKLHKCSFPYQT